jgi:hypothetical protein
MNSEQLMKNIEVSKLLPLKEKKKIDRKEFLDKYIMEEHPDWLKQYYNVSEDNNKYNKYLKNVNIK